MKRLIYLFIISLLLTASSAQGQTSQDVSFVHGLNDGPAVWNEMATQLSQEFIFSRDDVNYDDTEAISTAVAGASFPTNTVTVAHSLGGLLSREYLNQNGTGTMKALVTVGTPNTGAPVADAIQTPVIKNLSEVWYDRLLAGPMASIDILAYFGARVTGIPPYNIPAQRQAVRSFVANVLAEFGLDPNSFSGALASNIYDMFGNIESVDDMRPGSAFLGQLNDSPETTLPSARYAIYGSEDYFGFVRLFSSFQHKNNEGDPLEEQVTVNTYYYASALWLVNAVIHSYISVHYQLKAAEVGPGHSDYWEYQDYSFLHGYAAERWYLGFVNLVGFMPAEWRANITRSLNISDLISLDFSAAEADDALLSKSTQAPAFFDTFGDNIDRRLDADGANHLEETVHPSVKQRLEQVFENPDVLIDRVSDGGGGDPIDPPEPCYDENGNQIICPPEN